MNTNQIAGKILSTLQSGWNNADGNLFASVFASNSEFVDIRGTLHANASPHSLAAAHQALFGSIYKDSKVEYKTIQSIPITDDHFLLNAQAEMENPGGPMAGKNQSTISMIIALESGDWKIKAFHNTLKAPNNHQSVTNNS